ncbi:Bifunctional NAD(P)H-hydrate repair enzyme Nnr [compost metagenome]
MHLAVASITETRTLEETVMESWGIPQLLLMERAALAVAEVARLASQRHGPRIAILAGWGNNGGDGIAAARLLKGWGYDPVVSLLEGPMTPACAQQVAWARRWGVRVEAFGDRLPPADVYLDAIFGFGLNRPPQGKALRAIALLNETAAPVIAVDLPSGLDGSTGLAPGDVVHARHTVALGVLKTGLVTDPALAILGELWLGDLGFPSTLTTALPGDVIRAEPWAARPLTAHKGKAGFVLVVGGSRSMSGAPLMASLAAARIGAGLVYAAVPAGIRDVVAAGIPEAVVLPLPEDDDGGLSEAAWETLLPLLDRCHAGILGPGLGPNQGAMHVAGRLYREWKRPLVVDADALRAVSSPPNGPRILTPHPGEMSRMMGVSAAEIQADRLRWAREAAERWGSHVVLKGARTVVAEPGGRYGVNVGGHPVMATAGSGDVLAGLIGGLLAQGLPSREAARQGVRLHASLGEAGARGPAGRSMLALDMLNCLTDVLRSMPPIPAYSGSTPIRIAPFAKGEMSNDAGRYPDEPPNYPGSQFPGAPLRG